jgi:transposase
MVLADEQWAAPQPLVEACRPRGEKPPRHLRRTIEAILWRHQNGAKWRSIPAELGPWWIAAQTFIRWSRLGVWQRLLEAAHDAAVRPGMAFLDGTSIRAHRQDRRRRGRLTARRPRARTRRACSPPLTPAAANARRPGRAAAALAGGARDRA